MWEKLKMTNEKRALISGAASGIGRATAFRLSREGWSLLLTDRNAEGLEETRRLAPGGALTIAGDYSSEETARRLYSFFACKGARDLRCCARRWQVRMDEERAFGRLCRAGSWRSVCFADFLPLRTLGGLLCPPCPSATCRETSQDAIISLPDKARKEVRIQSNLRH